MEDILDEVLVVFSIGATDVVFFVTTFIDKVLEAGDYCVVASLAVDRVSEGVMNFFPAI